MGLSRRVTRLLNATVTLKSKKKCPGVYPIVAKASPIFRGAVNPSYIAVQSDCRTANYNIPVKSRGLIRVLQHTECMERVHVSLKTQKVRDAARSAAKELGYHSLKPEQLAVL